MYYGHTVAPMIESFIDNAAKDLKAGNEVAKDKDSYNIGYYNGAIEMARFLTKEIFGLDVIVEPNDEFDGAHAVVMLD